MAKAGKPAPARQKPPAGETPAPAAARRPAWWHMPLLLFVLICLTGIVPVALSGEVIGQWTLPGTSSDILPWLNGPTATPLPPIIWTAQPVDVLPAAGSGTPLAHLDAGYPLTVVGEETVGTTRWANIHLSGPTPAAGGSGWIPASAVTTTRPPNAMPTGDLGALSPTLNAALAPDQSTLGVALAFPSTGQTYLNASANTAFPLANGIRSVLLADLFASARAQHQPPPATTPASDAAALARGNIQIADMVYSKLGDASGVDRFLQALGVRGMRLNAGDWAGGQATPQALLQFYRALDAGKTSTRQDASAIFSLLATSDPTATALVPAPLLGSGSALIASSAQTNGLWTVSVAGVIAPAHGPQVVIVAVARDEPTESAANTALRSFYAKLVPLIAG